MATKANEPDKDVEEFTDEEIEEAEDELDAEKEELKEDDLELSQELQEAYGSPEPEEKHTPHTILDKAMFKRDDTLRTTFLTESELGRPLLSVRFLLDLHKSALHYDLPLLKEYYRNKIENITKSGLSNKGFGMNLNVTQKRDTTRRRVKEAPKEVKGGRRYG